MQHGICVGKVTPLKQNTEETESLTSASFSRTRLCFPLMFFCSVCPNPHETRNLPGFFHSVFVK